ncbi:MAG: hypothetical protein AAF600_02585 [Bacteroidota bacterium]
MTEKMPSMTWDLIDRYLTKDADYKDASRKAIFGKLGFKPNLKASIISEIQLRSSVRRLEAGEITQEVFDRHLTHVSNYVIRATKKWNLPKKPLSD